MLNCQISELFVFSGLSHRYRSPSPIDSGDHHRNETAQEYHSSKHPGMLRIPGVKVGGRKCVLMYLTVL